MRDIAPRFSPATLGPSTLMRLKSVSTELLDASGDPRLDNVLAEIELRLAVEIAKLTHPVAAKIPPFFRTFRAALFRACRAGEAL